MKGFIIITGIIILMYLLGFICKSKINVEWMNRNFTTSIKGFAILTVVWAHSSARVGVGGIQFIAGIGVALFLICSGYGLECSYEKNGLTGYWKKRILNVIIPFWIVYLIGYICTGQFTVVKYLKAFFFVTPGWFMQYILICYIIYYLVKVVSNKLSLTQNKETVLLIILFGVYFIVDSLFFADPTMPFLKARQMLSFPLGYMMAVYKNKVIKSNRFTFKNIVIFVSAGIIGVIFMGITQLQVIKQMPNIIQNSMSLFTVLPLAVAVLMFGLLLPKPFANKFLQCVGIISYELYLVHLFTLNLINGSVVSILIFFAVTLVIAEIVHVGIKRVIKNGRFNSSYIDKK